MKANEAPENVYLALNAFGDIIKDQWQFYRLRDDDIEYTRTDAFIKKVCEFLDGCIPDYIDLEHDNVDTFMNVDNKRFIEDFKKYIEK